MLLDIPVKPDYEALLSNLRREGTPRRVHYLELFLDGEIKWSIINRYGLGKDIKEDDPYRHLKMEIELQRFLGYDYVASGIEGLGFPRETMVSEDTSEIEGQKRNQRNWTDEHKGPINSWEDFEKYLWPDPGNFTTNTLEWLSANLPEDMCIVAGCHSIFEQVTWLMGYEFLCYAINDTPDLVDAMFEKIGGIFHEVAKILAQVDRVEILFGGDDMGFKTGPMVAPETLINGSFPWHKKNAEVAHEAGKLYLLHACGNLSTLMDSLINYVKIDGRHSFEDEIEPVTEAKKKYGSQIALLGGIDVNFLCLADEKQIRKRVQNTLDICHTDGGYCLGSGNSVVNYMPVENYLVMMDEGRRYTA
ncbi:uroporphyrinogen-III decarboxylase-like protein [Candidatus Poribacteria bacterium]|nr:uroporphyrinogen-III decarboxylase-like protein [Candidatus Poribacteria bacterium]